MTHKPSFEHTGKSFPADSRRTVLIYLGVSALYGLGLAAAFWAAAITARSMQGGSGALPVVPWALAFALMIFGMLAVIYAFFFRPRELRVSEEEVRYVMWDGSGKKLARSQLENIEAGVSRVVLYGGGRELVVDRRFGPWEALRGELMAWAESRP